LLIQVTTQQLVQRASEADSRVVSIEISIYVCGYVVRQNNGAGLRDSFHTYACQQLLLMNKCPVFTGDFLL